MNRPLTTFKLKTLYAACVFAALGMNQAAHAGTCGLVSSQGGVDEYSCTGGISPSDIPIRLPTTTTTNDVVVKTAQGFSTGKGISHDNLGVAFSFVDTSGGTILSANTASTYAHALYVVAGGDTNIESNSSIQGVYARSYSSNTTVKLSGDISAAGSLGMASNDHAIMSLALKSAYLEANNVSGNVHVESSGADSFFVLNGKLEGRSVSIFADTQATNNGAPTNSAARSVFENKGSVEAGLVRLLAPAGSALLTNREGGHINAEMYFEAANSVVDNYGTMSGKVTFANSFQTQAGGVSLIRNSGLWDASGKGALVETTVTNEILNQGNLITANGDASGALQNTVFDFQYGGRLNNSGTITMANNRAGDQTIINGDYAGSGGVVEMDVFLDDDNSASDKFVINGNSSGTTNLLVHNVGGLGNQTVEGIKVVEITGQSAGQFSLAAPVQAGSYEYQLEQGSSSSPNDWYLRSAYYSTDIGGGGGGGGGDVEYIYRPIVSMYVTAESANADAGHALLGSLNQRMSNQYARSNVWGRALGFTGSSDGHHRFDYKQKAYGGQFGVHVFDSTNAKGTRQQAGLTAQLMQGHIKSKDRIRHLADLNEDTGTTRSTHAGLGAYFTSVTKDGGYLDLVSQVNHLSNRYKDSNAVSATQKGWQFGLSAEVGKPVANVSDWQVEPQAQISYLHTRYNDFNDIYSHVSGFNTDSLKARLGVRLSKDSSIKGNKTQFYTTANVHQELFNPKSVHLTDLVGTGSASVSEKFDKTSWELGAGMQSQVSKSTRLFADARYQRSFAGKASDGKLTLGIQTDF